MMALDRKTDMDRYPTSAADIARQKAELTKRRIRSGERAARLRKTQEALHRYAFDYSEAKRNGTALPNMATYLEAL